MIETRRTCVLSMAHLRIETLDALHDTPYAKWPILGNFIGDAMLLAHVSEDRGAEVSDDLWACMFWAANSTAPGARRPGFDYILFDRDVDPEEDGSDLPDLSVEPEPERTVYSINVRAVSHLTATMDVTAASEAEAFLEARRRAMADQVTWDRSDPFDFQVEGLA